MIYEKLTYFFDISITTFEISPHFHPISGLQIQGLFLMKLFQFDDF